MKTYKIEVQELLSRIIEVETENMEVAVSKVEELYKREEIVLDYTDLRKVDITPNDLIDERKKLTKQIIEYLYRDEKRHFEESNRPNDHIFLKLERLGALIG